MFTCSALDLPVQLPFMFVVIGPASAIGLGLYLSSSSVEAWDAVTIWGVAILTGHMLRFKFFR